GDELAPEDRTKSTDHSTAARRGLEHTTRAELQIRVAGKRVLDAGAPRHQVLDRDPASRVGIDHARLADDALRKSIQRERGDRAHDLLRTGASEQLLPHASPAPRRGLPP